MKSKLVPVFVAALLGIGLPLGTSGPASATPVQNNAPPPFPSVGAGNYYKVDYPGSTVEGELKTPVTYLLWIPDGVTQLRGLIVHQHGAGTTASIEGSTGAYDLQWQALAKKWDCALWSSSYHVVNEAVDLTPGGSEHWFDPRRGSEKTFLKAIDEFAAKSGHPELAKVPWILWGHSGGGIWADVMTDAAPGSRRGGLDALRLGGDVPQAERVPSAHGPRGRLSRSPRWATRREGDRPVYRRAGHVQAVSGEGGAGRASRPTRGPATSAATAATWPSPISMPAWPCGCPTRGARTRPSSRWI